MNFKLHLTLLLLTFTMCGFCQSVRLSEYPEKMYSQVLVDALKRPIDTLFIDPPNKYIEVPPLEIMGISNLVIYISDNMHIKAQVDGFEDPSAALLKIYDSKGIEILGNNSILSMRKDSYRDGEWRHIISIRGSENIDIRDLSLRDGGGDGIYIGESSNKTYCKDIRIENVLAENNLRQGISIVSVDGLKIARSIFKDTKGKDPAAGLDIEPNNTENVLKNIYVEECLFESNYNEGVKIALSKLTSTSQAVGIHFLECTLRNNAIAQNEGVKAEITIGTNKESPVSGEITFTDCLIQTSAPIFLYSRKRSTACSVKFISCSVIFSNQDQIDPAVLLEVPDYYTNYGSIGNLDILDSYFDMDQKNIFLEIKGARTGTLDKIEKLNIKATLSIVAPPIIKYISYDPDNNLDSNIQLNW